MRSQVFLIYLMVFFAAQVSLGKGRGIASKNETQAKAKMSGYVQDVKRERNEAFYEVNLSAASPIVEDYRSFIFNEQLTHEFREKYVQKFGYIDTQSLSYTAVRFVDLAENRGLNQTTIVANQERRTYGEYVIRRLSEWHVDNYFKSDPSVRPLYEAKERLSNMSVQMGKRTQAKIAYSLSDNSIEVNLENPYCDSKLRIEMNPKTIGPTEVLENRWTVGKELSKKYYINSQVAEKDGVAELEWRNRHTAVLGSSIRARTPIHSHGTSVRENFGGVAMGWTF